MISVRCLANQNHVHIHLPQHLWSSCEYLTHYQSENSYTHRVVINVLPPPKKNVDH